MFASGPDPVSVLSRLLLKRSSERVRLVPWSECVGCLAPTNPGPLVPFRQPGFIRGPEMSFMLDLLDMIAE